MAKYFKSLLIIFLLCFFSNKTQIKNYTTISYFSLFQLKTSKSPESILALNHPDGKLIFGKLITYKNLKSKKVYISGDFSHWKPVPMNRSKYGVWFYIIKFNTQYNNYSTNRNIIRYKLIVDDIWILDNNNPLKMDDNLGSYYSYVIPEQSIQLPYQSYRIIDYNKYLVEFKIYLPNAKFVSIAGDFNNWNPEIDLLKKDKNGFWKITKKLHKGIFKYNFIVDGKWKTDLYNSNVTVNHAGILCSYIKIE